jgi:DHA2 family multidrug resistance protein
MNIARSGSAAKWPITISVMLATVMNSLDTTIANVALPHIQGSVSASQDQIAWVLTSYIVASTIFTPMTGWLAGRIGRKQLLMVSIGGFTAASALCGMSNSLAEIVGFRLLQGVFGASLIPLSQAVLLDVWPKNQHGQAMSIWAMGAILGPILGPALGGWLTDNLDWRWVFYINLPVGLLAFTGVVLFISGKTLDNPRPFDFFGFGSLAVFIAAFQLMLDRGPSQDWFGSKEIWTEAIVAMIAFWLFIVHSMTAKNPFFDRTLLRDRSFMISTLMGLFVGLLLYSSMALLPTMLEVLMGYPVVTTGLVTMPRGLGAFCAMLLVGRLTTKVDSRLVVLSGLLFCTLAAFQMSHFSLQMDSRLVVISGVFQGLGTGLIFVPLSTLAFATLAPSLRNEGSALFTLVRNMGGSAGISVIEAVQTHNSEVAHADLASHISRSDPVLQAYLPAQFSLNSTAGLDAFNEEITRQATMVAYVDDFKLLIFLSMAAIPLLLLLRAPKKKAGAEPVEVIVE